MPTNKPVLHSDLTDQHIAFIQTDIIRDPLKETFWENLSDKKKWEKGYTSIKYRKQILKHVDPSTIAPLSENVAPVASKIEYATFTLTVANYGGKVPYTREDVEDNYDSIVDDINYQIKNDVNETKEALEGANFVNSAITITKKTTYLETFRAAKTQLKKNGVKPFYSDGTYLAVVTPEILEAIQTELAEKGVLLPDETKKDLVVFGDVYKLAGFTLTSNGDACMYKTSGGATNQVIVFLGKYNGKNANVVYSDAPEIIHNPLGSGVLEDSAGNITSDDNKQKGSVAWNLRHFGVVRQEDLALMNCVVSGLSVVAESSQKTTASAQSNYTSGSDSPKNS